MTFGPPSGSVSGIDTLSYLNQQEMRYVLRTIAQRAPTARDKTGHAYAEIWVDQSTDNVYCFTNVSSGSANWEQIGGGTSGINTVNAGSGSATPSGNAITLAGTANQITTTGSGSTVTFALASALTAPGSVTATTTLTATSGAITATNGNLVLGSAGKSSLFMHPQQLMTP